FRDQFEALVTATSGFSPAEAYSLRVALLRADADGSTTEMKERFAAGCAANGLDAEGTDTLWQALAASAPDLQSRCSIAARTRAAMWAAFFKAEHPAAFLAAHLAGSMDRGGVPLRALLGEAVRLKVGIKPPDASHSMPAPTLERGGSEWTILWGLALLPGWTRDAAARFVSARPRGGFGRLADLALAAVDAGLTSEQLESLVLAGGCDTLGGQARSREVIIEALPSSLEWARAERGREVAAKTAGPADLFSFNDAQPTTVPDEKPTLGGSTLTPRERYLRRAWEVAHIGAGFTPAGEIEALKRTLDSSHLHARLLRSVQVGEEHVGKSVNLVGLLTRIRLVSPPASNGNAEAPSAADPMSVAWVEDTEGAIELVAFPPGYKRHAELWTENSLVIVTGRVRKHDDGEVYLLCEHMAAFDLGLEETEISVRVKQSKKAQAAVEEIASTSSPPAGNGTNVKGSGAYPASVPAPAQPPALRPASMPPAPTTAPANTPVIAAASTAATASTAPIMTNTAMTTTDGQPAHKIIITLPITEDDQADIDRMIALKEILHEHPGTDVVTLRIPYSPEPGHLTTAQLPRGVAYSTVLEAEVVRLLGTEAIGVIRL
ncbi:MAG TPA: OB-fold nucleic acid binding domain-containing protein, partial [Chloroflexia bacterium]|nr:OB-fold nucleic acid binding domain-containing protein [Chloroflexia bacterium]